MSRTVGRRGLAGAVLVLSFSGRSASADEPVMVYAAATLKNALDAVIGAAAVSLDVQVTPVYGPSPALVQQLQNGAPGDIFFSADADWMDEAVARGLVQPSTRIDLLSSALVLIAPVSHGKTITIAPGFPLAASLGSGRLAMCDPMMMPAGRYGRSALQKLGVWDSVKDRVANAADVQTALVYVSRQEAALGIVFNTDARLDPGVKIIAVFSPDSHPRIVYPLAVVARSHNPSAVRVFEFLTSDTAKSMFASFGYTALPKP